MTMRLLPSQRTYIREEMAECWWLFAPSVIAANGDSHRIDDVLARPGIAYALSRWHQLFAKLTADRCPSPLPLPEPCTSA